MYSGKSLLTSKTAIGTFVALGAMLASKFGFEIGDQGELVSLIVSVLGSVFALYGRAKAVKKIDGLV